MNEPNENREPASQPANPEPPTTNMPIAAPPPAPATNAPWTSQPQPRRSDRNGALILGVILVVVGAWLLLRQFIPALDLGRLWPIILVVAGGVLVVSAFWRRSE